MSALSLIELNTLVRNTIETTLDQPFWVQAELSSVSERNQHCFLEFVQKAPESETTLLAKARGQIWARTWTVLRPYFERTTGQPLCAGMKVQVEVEVTFHELYGYSLNVVDINPSFTLGDMAQRRQEILQKLRDEGVADMNKTLSLPLLLKRIAVISSDSAAGWGDFRSQLLDNNYNLAFNLQLFPATMQGERVESSIIDALGKIHAEIGHWDVVVIIRGGGATSDLSGFDSLPLAEHVAQFPLPIITGIGHERDDTIIDIISHTRVKTPTAAAEFILQHQLTQLERLKTIATNISTKVADLMHLHRMRLANITTTLPAISIKTIGLTRLKLDSISMSLKQTMGNRLEREQSKLKLIDTGLQAANPDHILQLGYSIVRHNGKAITDTALLHHEDQLQITLHRGTLTATINGIKE